MLRIFLRESYVYSNQIIPLWSVTETFPSDNISTCKAIFCMEDIITVKMKYLEWNLKRHIPHFIREKLLFGWK